MTSANVAKLPLIAAALAATLNSNAVDAVYLGPNGTGQVLIFPYYTVRNGFNTLFTIVNTQSNTKIVKVRFRESINARQVLDFNLFLSPNDTWAGAVVPTAQGARIVTNDNSCAVPADLFAETRSSNGLFINEFKNFQYAQHFPDTAQFATLDRTREGYFEVFEMGVIDPSLSATAAQIVANVRPDVYTNPAANCAALDKFDPGWLSPPPTFPNTGAAMMAPPSGGLTGRASLINAVTGANYSFGPTALEAFSSQVIYGGAGAELPSLASASPATSMVTTANGIVIAKWANGRDAVSAALMRDTIVNEFVIDEGTASQTDWIVTFPTKMLHTDRMSRPDGAAVAPFLTDSSTDPTSACEPYLTRVFSREAVNHGGSDICPVPPPAPPRSFSFCLAANIAPLASTASIAAGINNASGLLGAALPSQTGGTCGHPGMGRSANATSTPGFAVTPALRGGTQGPNGTIRVALTESEHFVTGFRPAMTPVSATLISAAGTATPVPGRHYGLPVIGLMLHNYKNANVVSRYGGVIEHSYTVRIE